MCTLLCPTFNWLLHRDSEPNVAEPNLLAQNWGNLWRILADIPLYNTLLRGRIFPDLINEPRYYSTALWLIYNVCGALSGPHSAQPAKPF